MILYELKVKAFKVIVKDGNPNMELKKEAVHIVSM